MTEQSENEHIHDTLSRIDERVKSLFDNNLKTDRRLEVFLEIQNQLIQRVTALESKNGTEIKRQVEELNNKMHDMELKLQSSGIISIVHQTRWEKIIEHGTKLLIA